MHKYVFTDTNLFEQFQPIENIDWVNLSGGDTVTLVVPAVTLSELNKHKDGAIRGRIKRRAANVLSQLSAYSRQPGRVVLRNGVDLIFRHQEPLIDFTERHLSKDVPDDRLLASAIEFAGEKNILDRSVMVATGDLGLELKIKGQDLLNPLLLPQELRLADELDPEETKIKELTTELQRIRSSIPELNLSFAGGAVSTEIALEPPVELNMEKVEEGIADLKRKHPLLGGPPPDPLSLLSALAGLTGSELEYNSELVAYYGAYRGYYDEVLKYLNRQNLSTDLDFLLHNSGGAPADDIDIELHFPDGFAVLDAADEEDPPKEPRPPLTPQEKFARMVAMPNILLPNYNLPHLTLPQPAGNTQLKSIKKTNSYFVRVFVKKLKHTMSESLPPIRIRFDCYDAVKPFGVEYRVVAGNLPTPVVGKLHVIVGVK